MVTEAWLACSSYYDLPYDDRGGDPRSLVRQPPLHHPYIWQHAEYNRVEYRRLFGYLGCTSLSLFGGTPTPDFAPFLRLVSQALTQSGCTMRVQLQ